MVGTVWTWGHTRTHVCLPEVSAVVAEQEIAGSRTDMERQLGAAPSVFAYPYGEVDEVTQELVRGLGFSAACGVQEGLNSPATPAMRYDAWR
jgi:peptidoglycan/xylan/chitin deacetylase (PgdA/CDA1 family)